MTIVVGYVSKPEGEAALAAAVDRAKARGARLVIVNSRRDGSNEELAGVEEKLAGAGVEYELRGLARGLDPAEDLLGVARDLEAELIIIGLRRRSPIGKLILGSNAQRILIDAECPVLAVKAAE